MMVSTMKTSLVRMEKGEGRWVRVGEDREREEGQERERKGALHNSITICHSTQQE